MSKERGEAERLASQAELAGFFVKRGTGSRPLAVDFLRTSNPDEIGRAVRPDPTPENPGYRMQKQEEEGYVTSHYMIVVDEGWRTWILCEGMYEWAAAGLLEVLKKSGHQWPRP